MWGEHVSWQIVHLQLEVGEGTRMREWALGLATDACTDGKQEVTCGR